MNLKRRLENATERAVLFQIFADVRNDPQKYGNAIEALCESVDCFSKFLTNQEYLEQFKPILDTQCPIRSIIGFSKSISNVISTVHEITFRDIMTVLDWLKYVAERSLSKSICDSLKVIKTDVEAVQLHREFVAACINLPEKIMNCRAKALTDEHVNYINRVNWIFKENLIQGIEKAMLLAHDYIKISSCSRSAAPSDEPYLNTIAEFIAAGRNIELSSKHTLLDRLIKWIGLLEGFDAKWRLIMARLFLEPSNQGIQVHEALLTSMFLNAKSEEALMRCVVSEDLTGTLKRVVMVKLPFQRVLKFKTMKILVNYIHRIENGFGLELLETALKIWSDVNYVKAAPESQEQHIVRIIVYSIYLFKNSAYIAWDSLFLLSMNGVHNRMNMMPLYVQSALFINQTLCKLATEHRPKSLDVSDPPIPPPENADDDTILTGSAWLEEMNFILENGVNEDEHNEVIKKKEAPEASKYNDHISECQDAVGTSKEKEGEDHTQENCSEVTEEITNAENLQEKLYSVDSDDEEDFPVYEIDESEKSFKPLELGEEPRQKVSSPSYIADAFEMLLEKEKYEVFEAAFFNIIHLINRRAIGFNQIAEKLFVRVIHLQNNFGTSKFNETVDEIAVACIAQRPEIVPSLVRLIIAPEQGFRLQQRLLHYIHLAADEMGALDRKHEEYLMKQQRLVGGFTLQNVHNHNDDSDYDDDDDEDRASAPHIPEWRRVVDARIAAKTRRIGTAKQGSVGVVNRLANAVNYMFFPLLVVPRGEQAKLLGKDSDLLSYIIMVASMVYVRCGVCPMIGKMSTELISYVTPHRFSENAKLRTACLGAHLNVLAVLPADLVTEFFNIDTIREWFEWADAVMSAHTVQELEYDMAHQLCAHLIQHYQQHINNDLHNPLISLAF